MDTPRPPVDTPLHVTHYDQDVAVYKPSDPVSQVSSSTDSGYGHNQCFDRMQSDMHFRHAGEQLLIRTEWLIVKYLLVL